MELPKRPQEIEEGRMNLFGKILEVTIKTIALPISIVADVVTLGGVITDKKRTYTGEALRDLYEDIDELGD
jgi:hypothetical protein